MHFIGLQDSTRDALSVNSSSMLTTTNDKYELVRAEGEFEDKPGMSEYRDCGVGQKQTGLPVYEAVTSWSDEVA